MTNRVGTKGQVVIPKPVRDKLGIRPGDEVLILEQDGEARMRPLKREARLRGLLRGGAATADVEAEHRRELESDADQGIR